MFFTKPTSRKSENLPNLGRSGGFTLAEVMVAVFAVSLLSTGVIFVLLQMNSQAMSARLRTLATVSAMNQVALISTDAPFSPPDGQVPVDLSIGTQTAPILIYDDPNSIMVVSGTMTTTVEDPGYWQNGYNLNLRRVTVTVAYTFRKRSYSVILHTIRASDV